MPHNLKSIVMQFAGYLAIMLIAAATIHFDSKQPVETAFGEDSLTEYLHQFYAFLAACFFALAAPLRQQTRGVSILLAGFFLVICIREYDWFLDTIYHGLWLYPALLTTAIAIFMFWRSGSSFKCGLMEFTRLPCYGTFLSGFLILLVFSRLYGTGSVWRQLMGENYIHAVKNASQEGIELLGYSLILISAIQFYMAIRRISAGNGNAPQQ
ncbi:MAG: hypothetical protein OQJ91_10740 [Motiliproteus sp.]|nr:hypothetical protein [Motiliproteus sp.]